MKLYMFRTVPLSIIRIFFAVHTTIGICHTGLLTVASSCQQTCITYTIAVCTVKNSWWWTEGLSETCRVWFQNKCEKLVHLVGFIIRDVEALKAKVCKTSLDLREHNRGAKTRSFDRSNSIRTDSWFLTMAFPTFKAQWLLIEVP
jgi:hypothetical protein